MTRQFKEAFGSLNNEQRQAVETIEGPVLVIAGPGTGKTQLLSARVANILAKTDSLPSNILCLTFTDNAARNMRERLVEMIGRPAYHVAIHTFHSFGAEIINHNPDYFTGRQLLQQVDELGRYELLAEIFEDLPHSNPFSSKVGDNFVFINDALDAISWLKQNALTPPELHAFLNANKALIDSLAGELSATFSEPPLAKYLPKYEEFLRSLRQAGTGKLILGFPDFASQCASELETALSRTEPARRYAPEVTRWRNSWCQKDAEGLTVFKDSGRNYRKMQALANVYQKLLESMSEQGLYDFDDMVMAAVQAVEQNPELRFNLQEKYQYVLIDEFQDTNKAQLRMLIALGDNPVYEGRPNIMAVGDSDQAIYAFQGAESSNMAVFAKLYGVKPITLTENYRSAAGILEVAEAISAQISDRPETGGLARTESLRANKIYRTKTIDYLSFASELAQYDWIAGTIEGLVEKGMAPEQIGVIAPRHRYLERLMPYLGAKQLPVVYERRENILEAPIIIQLTSMAELVVAIAENRQTDIDSLFGQVLGYDFWAIEPPKLIAVSLECYRKHKSWLEVLANHKDSKLRSIAGWFAGLARRSRLEPMEYMMDRLVGGDSGGTDSEFDEIELPSVRRDNFVSPLKDYYFGAERFDQSTESYLTLLGQLSTLRQRLRQWKPNRGLRIKDLTEFVRLNLEAGLKIVDTNPHTQATKAVQVMTAYKAKGLEFDAVFVINAQDEVWGPTARSRTSRISLPRNLPIAPTGDSEDDKIRLLFVALTRARHSLYITGYVNDLENKPSPALSFIADINSLTPRQIDKPASVKSAEILSTDWSYRFRQAIAAREALMEPMLQEYKLSVTHLNNFIDVANGGPRYFLMHNLLRFPEALSPSAAYGDAVHQTIKWFQTQLRQTGRRPAINKTQNYFSDMLDRQHLKPADHRRLDTRGREALNFYLGQESSRFQRPDLAERGFNNDGVVVGQARLSGKIDLMHFKDSGIVEVLDFKTGKPAASWQGRDEFEKIKLHKYHQQLLFYKLLVEHSASFQNRLKVISGRLEFIEPNEQGKLLPALELNYDDQETSKFVDLIKAVWSHIMALDFPDTAPYPRTLSGIRKFESDLIDSYKNTG